jgi:hypothetical protein
MTTTQKSMKAKKENNISHGIDDAAIVSMETHTLMNGT